MAAHNSVNGMPCHGNYDLLTAALRQNFGFAGGLCASDAGDIGALVNFRIVPDVVHAAAWALNAGMDQDLQFNGNLFPIYKEKEKRKQKQKNKKKQAQLI